VFLKQTEQGEHDTGVGALVMGSMRGQRLCLGKHTSKLSAFEDLKSLQSYGFRGEALHALCAAGDVSISTRTLTDAVTMLCEYEASGSLVCVPGAPIWVDRDLFCHRRRESPCAGETSGTTVVVRKLFGRCFLDGCRLLRKLSECEDVGFLCGGRRFGQRRHDEQVSCDRA
jgi:hypothetical protein